MADEARSRGDHDVRQHPPVPCGNHDTFVSNDLLNLNVMRSFSLTAVCAGHLLIAHVTPYVYGLSPHVT